MMIEAVCFSETLVDFQRTTMRYIPEESTLHNHRCENLKFYNPEFVHKRNIIYLIMIPPPLEIRFAYVNLKNESKPLYHDAGQCGSPVASL
jgi:hypothetical protein